MPQQPDRLAVAIPGLYPTLNTLYRWAGWPLTIDRMNGKTPYNTFSDYTKDEAGRKAELLYAFVFGGWDLGEGRKATVGLGRHSLQWGESLFFGDNAIARAQGPIDIFKLLASPNAQFKEIIRPIPQISSQVQLSSDVSVGAYYQFRWEADRLAPAGSYYSTSNLVRGGSSPPQPLGLGPGGTYTLAPSGDREPKKSGQFGVQLKWRVGETDLGLYMRGSTTRMVNLPPNSILAARPMPTAGIRALGITRSPQDVKVAGTSASISVGDLNISLEGSVRDDMPLRSGQMIHGFFPGQAALRPASGRTDLSWLATFGPGFIAQEAAMIGEIASNRVLSKTDPDQTLDSGRTRNATAIQMVYMPSYRQVLSGLDLNVPLGIRYAIDGNSSITSRDASADSMA